MKETEVSYIAGVVDSIGLIRVKVKEKDDMNTGLFLKPRITINRDDSQAVVLGMVDEYAMEVGVHAEAHDAGTSHRLEVTGVEDIRRFLEPLEPWLIQKHEQLDIFLGEVLPAIEEGKHHTKEGMVELMEKVDEMYELDPTINNWKYTAGYLRQKWSNELA